MMEERLLAARPLLKSTSSLWISLDDTESNHCRLLGESAFGTDSFIADIAWEKVYSPRMDATKFSTSYDHVLSFAFEDDWSPNRLQIEPNLEQFPHVDEKKRHYRSDPLRKWGKNSLKTDRQNLWFPITSPDGVEVYPIKPDGREGCWRWQKSTVEAKYEELDWLDKGNGLQPYVRQYADNSNFRPVETIWRYEEAGSTHEAQEVLKALLPSSAFPTPKPPKLVKRVQLASLQNGGGRLMDFFAGSGASGQSVIELNREMSQNTKFILVEMGEYFQTVLVPRISKLVYTPNWSKGKPKEDPNLPMNGVYPDWVERSPRLVKVMRLESYEDSLNALELPQEQSARAKGMQDLFGDEYLLKYLLPTELEDVSEVYLNTERLETPFDYHLRNYTPEGAKNLPVDLVETFNLLMGYHVKRIFKLSGEREYRCVEAHTEAGKVLVVWRNIEGLDPEAERAFLEEQLDLDEYSTIYANADIAVPKGQSLDREFKDRLLARAVGVLA